MKSKLLTILLIGLLVFSTSSFALAEVECPTCQGTGSIVCTECNGTGEIEGDIISCENCTGTGTLTPKIYMRSLDASQQNDATNITAVYYNHEIVTVNGTVTASLAGHTATSPETVFPPNKDVTIHLQINYMGSYTQLQLMRSIQMTATPTGDITCPYCNGEGTTAQTSTCPECDGTGTVECPDCGGTGYVEEGALIGGQNSSINLPLIAGGVGVGVAVACVVVASVMLLRKRRVSEKSLRNRSNSDFQAWVLKKLEGRASTSMDIALGIDGFSRLGEPICIKQSDSVGLPEIDRFAVALAKSRARNGTMVAFGFSGDAIRGKVRARTNFKVDIQMMTVQELIMKR